MMKVLIVGSFHLPENATPAEKEQYAVAKQQFNAVGEDFGTDGTAWRFSGQVRLTGTSIYKIADDEGE